MMMPDSSDDFGSSRLLHDIEEISKALYFQHPPPKPKYEDSIQNVKKSSIWKWKPLKALTHIRNHRFACSFFLHIHSIEGLPPTLNDLGLCVYWKRKNEILKSLATRVRDGVAEFEHTLVHRCTVYVGKSGPNDDVAKYKPKFSLLYVSIIGASSFDLGKHWIDLTSLLPVSLMELEDEKNQFGRWITSFKLTGKAKGAMINVSFGFSLSGDNLKVRNFLKGSGSSHGGMLRRVRSIPSGSSRRSRGSTKSLDMKAHNGILPYEGSSIGFLYDLLDESKSSFSKGLNLTSTESESSREIEVYDSDFTVVDKGIELPQLKMKDCVETVENSCIQTIDVAEIFDRDEEFECKNDVCTEEPAIEELESFFSNLSISESPESEFSFCKNEFLDRDYRMMNMLTIEESKMIRSRSLDDLTDAIVDDFMNLVGSDSEPESPRERLLRQFEQEADFDFDLDSKEDQEDPSGMFDSSFLFQGAEIEHDNGAGPSLISRRKAKMLENLETEELMREWGLNERAFQNSPRSNSGAFGSPVYLSPERPPDLPPLGEGLGSFLKTKSGFLRSMNPTLFKRAKNGEKLIVQVSNSVVLPAAMGSTGSEILVNWARAGAEKMRFQAAKLMPVEEITGKTLQEAVWEAEENPTTICSEIDSESVLLKNIVLLTIEKIQFLLMEGLRIQSGTSIDDPPASISVNFSGENAGSPSSDSFENREISELISMSISFEEWENLNSTFLDEKSELHDHISEISEGQAAKMESIINKFGTFSDQDRAYFNNEFTLAFRILLRDPFRDYEPVGIPMLGLAKVKRTGPMVKPVFQITELYVSGFRIDPGKRLLSGSRWLQSSGMTAKSIRHPLSKSNALVRSSSLLVKMPKPEDTLWSISSYVHGGLSTPTLYVRNPDIVFK